jgi:hypothetical protein
MLDSWNKLPWFSSQQMKQRIGGDIMKKKLVLAAVILAVIAALIQIGRYADTYPVSPIPFGKGIGSTLYIASCEPYHPYLEGHDRAWYYLFQAPLEGEEFDETAEKLIYGWRGESRTHMNAIYTVETYRVSQKYTGAELISQESLLWKKDTHIQKKINALAPKTSEENPLYFVWCGGNLYGVIDQRAYLLWQGKDGKRFLISLPEFQKTEHTLCVVEVGPITEDDYYEAPDSPS